MQEWSEEEMSRRLMGQEALQEVRRKFIDRPNVNTLKLLQAFGEEKFKVGSDQRRGIYASWS